MAFTGGFSENEGGPDLGRLLSPSGDEADDPVRRAEDAVSSWKRRRPKKVLALPHMAAARHVGVLLEAPSLWCFIMATLPNEYGLVSNINKHMQTFRVKLKVIKTLVAS